MKDHDRYVNFFFFFNDTATTEIYTLSLHDALPILVAGWLAALPVPLMLIWAPSWSWVLFANVWLGASQGLAWSMTVVTKIDLDGPERRGLAMGLNEFAGYGAVAHGLRPYPFLIGVAIAFGGLAMS